MPGSLIGRLLGIPSYRDKTTAFVISAQEAFYKAILVLLTITAVLWMAVFLYATFYYSYMPAISHSRPVHLQFQSCGREEGLCSHPTANVTLTTKQHLLMVGQPYKILLELEMPESPANKRLGMFMVCADLKDKYGVVIVSSCRSTILHYKSGLLHGISTLVLTPFLLSGSAEEKQMVPVELFSNFEEDPNRPVTEAYVQIRSQHVELYQTYIKIHAHFTGLRYIMFHWPMLSALVGITTNLFFLTIIAFLSWYKFFTPKQAVFHVGYDSTKARTLEERRTLAKQRLMKERGKLLKQGATTVPNHAGASSSKEDLMEPSDLPPVPPPKVDDNAETAEEPILSHDSDDCEFEKKQKVGRSTSDEYEIISAPEVGRTNEQDIIVKEEHLNEKIEIKSESCDTEEEEEEDKENSPLASSDLTTSTEQSVRHRGTPKKKL